MYKISILIKENNIHLSGLKFFNYRFPSLRVLYNIEETFSQLI